MDPDLRRRVEAQVFAFFNEFAALLGQRSLLTCDREVKDLEELAVAAIGQSQEEFLTKRDSTLSQLPDALLERLMVSLATQSMRFLAKDLRLLLSSSSKHLSLCLQPPEDASQLESYRRNLQDILQLVKQTCKDSLESISIEKDLVSPRKLNLLESAVQPTALSAEDNPRDETSDLSDLVSCLAVLSPCNTPSDNDVTLNTPDTLENDTSALIHEFVLELLCILNDLSGVSVTGFDQTVSDQTLRVIAERHSNITNLDADDSGQTVTSSGLEAVTAHCKDLCLLKLTQSTHLSAQDIAHAIQELPELEEIRCFAYPGGMVYYALHLDSPLPRKIDFVLSTYSLDFILTPANFVKVLHTFPQVDSLGLDEYIDNETVSALEQVNNNIQYIKFEDPDNNVPLQKRLYDKFPNLVQVEISDSPESEIHLGLIGSCCLNLRHCMIHGVIITGDDYPTQENHFTKLVNCNLNNTGQFDVPVPNRLIKQLFSSPALRHLIMERVFMSDGGILDACDEHTFPALETFRCVGGLYSVGSAVRTYITLACRAPLLRELSVGTLDPLSSETCEVAKSFFTSNLPTVTFSIY